MPEMMRTVGVNERPKAWMIWTGRVMTALPVLGFTMSAVMKFMHAPELVQQFSGKLGYPESSLTPIGIIEITCVILYAVPRTAVLGALLLTGYLGGAVATHLRIGDSVAAPVLLGVMLWGGLFLRDARIRALLPLVK